MKFSSEQLTLLAKADAYGLLSLAFLYPDAEVVSALRQLGGDMADIPASAEIGDEVRGEILSALESLEEGSMRQEFTRLFLRGGAPLAESSCTTNLNALADVSAYYAAFGVTPKNGESPESLPYELEFLSVLSLKAALADTNEHRDVSLESYHTFLGEHLSPFVAAFAARIAPLEPQAPYDGFARALVALVRREAGDFEHIPLTVLDSSQPWGIDSYLDENAECALSPDQSLI